MEKLDWGSYNEGVTLKESVGAYYDRWLLSGSCAGGQDIAQP